MSFNSREEAQPASAWRSSLFELYAPCVLSSVTIDSMVTAVWLFNRDNHKHRVNLVAERGKELIPNDHLSVDRCLYIDNVLTQLATFLETPIWNFEAHCPLNRPWIRLSLVNFFDESSNSNGAGCDATGSAVYSLLNLTSSQFTWCSDWFPEISTPLGKFVFFKMWTAQPRQVSIMD